MRYLGEGAGGAERISCGVGVEGAVERAGSWHGTGTNMSLQFCHQLPCMGTAPGLALLGSTRICMLGQLLGLPPCFNM